MSSKLTRVTAWLCLIVTLLTAVVPAHGFVICFEPDGGMCVGPVNSSSFADACGGCDRQKRSVEIELSGFASAEEPYCPCVDIVVPSQPHDDRIQPQLTEITLRTWMMAATVIVFQPFVFSRILDRSPPRTVPRPSESLAHIRSVVLLV